jgi:dCTP deaminase
VILTDREIKLSLAKDQFSIDPLPSDRAFSSTAVDLTLGSTARRFKASVDAGLRLDPGHPKFRYRTVVGMLTDDVATDPDVNLETRTLLLAWTREFIALPEAARVAARVEGKSSLARLGVGVHITAPTIHAGFKGQIQLEIVNHGPAPVTLRAGMPICQLIFETTLGTPEKGYAGIFAGQTAGDASP